MSLVKVNEPPSLHRPHHSPPPFPKNMSLSPIPSIPSWNVGFPSWVMLVLNRCQDIQPEVGDFLGSTGSALSNASLTWWHRFHFHVLYNYYCDQSAIMIGPNDHWLAIANYPWTIICGTLVNIRPTKFSGIGAGMAWAREAIHFWCQMEIQKYQPRRRAQRTSGNHHKSPN